MIYLKFKIKTYITDYYTINVQSDKPIVQHFGTNKDQYYDGLIYFIFGTLCHLQLAYFKEKHSKLIQYLELVNFLPNLTRKFQNSIC